MMKKSVPAASPDAYVRGTDWMAARPHREPARIGARLKASGKYELATMQLHEGDTVSNAMARRLTREAIKLNALLGDPTKDARPVPKVKAKVKSRRAAPRSGH
jgi:hypothetical protein